MPRKPKYNQEWKESFLNGLQMRSRERNEIIKLTLEIQKLDDQFYDRNYLGGLDNNRERKKNLQERLSLLESNWSNTMRHLTDLVNDYFDMVETDKLDQN